MEFKAAVAEVEALNAEYGMEEPVRYVNHALGVLNQAVSFVENEGYFLGKVDSIPHSATQPAASEPNQIHHWYKKPLGLVAVGVAIPLLTAIAIYLVRTHLNIPL